MTKTCTHKNQNQKEEDKLTENRTGLSDIYQNGNKHIQSTEEQLIQIYVHTKNIEVKNVHTGSSAWDAG